MSRLAGHLARALDPVALARSLAFDPDPWQCDVLRSERSRLCLVVTRQGGKSTVAAVAALHKALYSPGSLVLIVSPTQRQSGELFRKVLTFYRQLGRPLPSEAENALSLTLENGSRVISVPGSESNIRGYSVDLLVIDEAARVDDALYGALSPMLAVSRGRVLALSTPWGRRGWWYKATRSSGWKTTTVAAADCPRIASEWLAEERDRIGDFWFRQEYEIEFLDAAGQMFSSDDIEAMFAAGGLGTLHASPLYGGSPGAASLVRRTDVIEATADKADPAPEVFRFGAPLPPALRRMHEGGGW